MIQPRRHNREMNDQENPRDTQTLQHLQTVSMLVHKIIKT